MRKIYGVTERQDGLYPIGRKKWELIYGFGKDNPEDETGYDYRQRFNSKPTANDVEEIIKAHINSLTDAKILSGFSWRGMPVWLSQENQFNYKVAYDLAVQTEGANLPVKFKFGTDDNPQYSRLRALMTYQISLSSQSSLSTQPLTMAGTRKNGYMTT